MRAAQTRRPKSDFPAAIVSHFPLNYLVKLDESLGVVCAFIIPHSQDRAKEFVIHVSLEPQISLSDFELAIKQAVELSFPTTDFRGCYILSFLLSFDDKVPKYWPKSCQDSNVNRFLRRTAALAFVQVRFVRPAWQAIKVAAPQLPRIQEFIRYFEDTWLVGN